MIRVVADTNVYISGTFWAGVNRLFIGCARHELIELVCSKEVLEELARTLGGKKFGLSEGECDKVLADVMSYTVPFKAPVPAEAPHQKLRDPKDLYVLNLASASRAAYLVTGDHDLLVLKKTGHTSILSARDFLKKEFPELIDGFDLRR